MINKKLFILFGFLIAILALLVVFTLMRKSPNPNPSSSPLPAFSNSPQEAPSFSTKVDFKITSVSPAQGTILKANQPLAITINFNQPIQLGWVGIKLSSGLISVTTLSSLPYSVNLSADSTALLVTTAAPTAPLSQYSLILTNLTQNTPLGNVNYPTEDASPSPLPSNNPSLTSYLPYETANYSLSYSSSDNLYVFHFKFDPNSSVDIDTQYNQAKADATTFIQSKGIDINSVVVDWRHS